jgi:predicted nucleic acid-binding protein
MPAEARARARVVDASALGAVLFAEPEADEVAGRLEGVVLIAPALLRFEVANICWKKMRRHPEKRDALVAAHDLLARMEIHEVEVRFEEVLELAEADGITVYDASYLWLGRTLDLELVTLDRGLARAAAKERPGGPRP